MTDDATNDSSKTNDEKTPNLKPTTSSTGQEKDGSTVFTTRSAKDTVTVNDCSCKTDMHIGRMMPRDWRCRAEGMYYCPKCNDIRCGSCVGAPQEMILSSYDDPDYIIRWGCIECHTYVFEMNPIMSTALALGLPIPIEADKLEDDDESS